MRLRRGRVSLSHLTTSPLWMPHGKRSISRLQIGFISTARYDVTAEDTNLPEQGTEIS